MAKQSVSKNHDKQSIFTIDQIHLHVIMDNNSSSLYVHLFTWCLSKENLQEKVIPTIL